MTLSIFAIAVVVTVANAALPPIDGEYGVRQTEAFVEYYNNYEQNGYDYQQLYSKNAVLMPAGYKSVKGSEAILAFRQKHDKYRELSIDMNNIKMEYKKAGFAVSGRYETYGDGGMEQGYFMNVYTYDKDMQEYVIDYSMYNIYNAAEYYYGDDQYLGLYEQNANAKSMDNAYKSAYKFVEKYNSYEEYSVDYSSMYAADAVLYPAGYEYVEGKDAILEFRQHHDMNRKMYIDYDSMKVERKYMGYVVTGKYETRGDAGVEMGNFINMYEYNEAVMDYVIYFAAYNIYQPAEYYEGDYKYYGVYENYANNAYAERLAAANQH